jgi:hypothetical protein
MNNESTQNNGSATSGEAGNMAGQNLPMTAHNDKLKDYLAKQTMDYQ